MKSSLVVCVSVPHIRKWDSYQVHNGDICRMVADRHTASIIGGTHSALRRYTVEPVYM